MTDPRIWGEGWYAIFDNECEPSWFVSPKKFFEETGRCPDGWEWDRPEGMTNEEFNEFVDEVGYEPKAPRGFYYGMESCLTCNEEWSLQKQKKILKDNGFLVDNVPEWHYDRNKI